MNYPVDILALTGIFDNKIKVNIYFDKDENAIYVYGELHDDNPRICPHCRKVYLSPLIDCFDGLPIVYTCGTSPNSELTNTMLIKGNEIIKNNNRTIRNDRGFHYRFPSRITLMKKIGYTRSMSKKGWSPDNSMCEGFFGTIKNEFYYPYDWTDTTCFDFIDKLNKYLKWFIEKRIKVRLWKNLKTVQ